MGRNGDIKRLYERLFNAFGIEDGAKVINIISEELGGLRVTIPTIKDLEREARDLRIHEEFRGNNHAELSIRYGTTVRNVRFILARKEKGGDGIK